MTEKKEEAVVEKPEGAGAEPTPAETPEVVASPEVKTEVREVEPEVKVDPVKLQEQVENLNKALKQERDSSKQTAQELKEELERSRETIDKLKDVFSPEQPKEDEQTAVTIDQVESLLEQRERQRIEDAQRESQMQAIKKEVAQLEKEWDGTGGKPKYDDAATVKWQEENDKLYLSPSEAFNAMNRDAIINWEIQNRMENKPEIKNVETPGGMPVSREPAEVTPKTTQELRSAVLEAMEIASGENTN